jgi:hypothetical protein
MLNELNWAPLQERRVLWSRRYTWRDTIKECHLKHNNNRISTLSSLVSSSSMSVQTPLGALSYGSAWAVRIKNNCTKNKVKLCEKRVYTVLVKNSWNHISRGWLFHYLCW